MYIFLHSIVKSNKCRTSQLLLTIHNHVTLQPQRPPRGLLQHLSVPPQHFFPPFPHTYEEKPEGVAAFCMTTLPLCHLSFAAISHSDWRGRGCDCEAVYFLFSGIEVAGCQLRAEVSACLSGTSSEPVNHWLSCQEYYISSQPPRLVTNNVTIFIQIGENRNVVFATLYRYIGAFNISPGKFVNAPGPATFDEGTWQMVLAQKSHRTGFNREQQIPQNVITVLLINSSPITFNLTNLLFAFHSDLLK